ncbi:hypothetical protein [Paenibacillus sp. SI8]|uniref:hypothetical protein n=1 Tax=unclassified Paenibacillus TaxID=185978 RepID=UPI0034653F4B
MSILYARYTEGISFTGDTKKDIERFFVNHNEHGTYQHTISVASEAVRIANKFLLDSFKNTVQETKSASIFFIAF